MQQQIQAEQPEEILPELNDLVQSEVDPEEHQDQLISEHYDQDFDPLQSGHLQQQNHQIQEQLTLEPQNKEVQDQTIKDQPQVDPEMARLREECAQMQQQIASLKVKIQKSGAKTGEEEETDENSQDVYEQLLMLRKENQEQLDRQQHELDNTISNKFGRDTITQKFIVNDGQMIGGKLLQEKLLEEEVRINALLHCYQSEIGKTKREIKKNGEGLENAQEEKDQMHRKYRNSYRESEEKKEKIERGEKKIGELDSKIEQLQSKIAGIEVTKEVQQGMNIKKLEQKWEELSKMKDQENKKISLLNHSCQNSTHSLNRILLDLKKQRNQLQQSIEDTEYQNNQLQQKSQAMMQSFTSNQRIQKHRYKNQNHFSEPQDESGEEIQPFRSPSLCQTNKISVMRRRNYSVQKKANQFANHSNFSLAQNNNPFAGLTGAALDAQLSAHDSLLTQLESKLKECSTDSVLKKQFKLKLPKNAPKSSKKYLDLSMGGIKEPSHPKIFSTKSSPSSKLSISQRIERIQNLQKEDRVHAYKLSNSKVAIKQRVNPSSQTSIEPSLESDLNLTLPLQRQKQEESTQKRFKTKEPENKMVSSQSKKKVNMVHHESAPQIQQKTITSFIPKSPFSQIELPKPQHLFSSIQQKLSMKQSRARQSFQIDNNEPKIQTNKIENESMGMSRLSRQSLVMKKRSSFREKKITDEYMRVLEERGRKILELDSQNDP